MSPVILIVFFVVGSVILKVGIIFFLCYNIIYESKPSSALHFINNNNFFISKINKKIDDIWNWSGSLVDQSEEINRTLGFFYSDYLIIINHHSTSIWYLEPVLKVTFSA